MLDWFLTLATKPRVSVVSYLNTVPLVWGMLHGEQRGLFDLSFAIPAECADRLESGLADIGIVPAVELNRQKLEIIRGAGIACHGPVRSIFLISKVPYAEIRKLAADSTSRTSVALSRVILARKFGVQPQVQSHAPHLPSMLENADAALIIGDAALVLDPADLPFVETAPAFEQFLHHVPTDEAGRTGDEDAGHEPSPRPRPPSRPLRPSA